MLRLSPEEYKRHEGKHAILAGSSFPYICSEVTYLLRLYLNNVQIAFGVSHANLLGSVVCRPGRGSVCTSFRCHKDRGDSDQPSGRQARERFPVPVVPSSKGPLCNRAFAGMWHLQCSA